MKTEDIINRAQALGSSATTFKGAVRYLLANHKYPKPLPLDAKPYIGLQEYSRALYTTTERHRKSNPEAKRARRDVKFRRNFLRRLATEQHRLLNPPVSTIAEITAAANALNQSAARLVVIEDLRSIALGKRQMAATIIAPEAGRLITVSNPALAKKYGATVIMVGKDAQLLATKRDSYGIHYDSTPSVKRNGKWTGFERAQHDNYVRSFALIINPTTIDYAFHKTVVRLTLPDTCSWSSDSNGFKIVQGPDDYHPDAEELLDKDAVSKLLLKLSERAATRKLYAAQKAAEAAEMEGVFCCVADSIRAGNCRQGTMQFAVNHQLDPQRHYKATELLRIANGEAGRVRLVIRAACNRHKSELELGYSKLSNHIVQ